MYSRDRAEELIADGKLRANPRTGSPQYLLDASTSTMLDTNWTDIQEYDTKFNFPNGEKNVNLIIRILSMLDDENAVVLDSFAGSGTTAHAVQSLNKEDGGNRKFILVECEDYADTITAERVRSVINGAPGVKGKTLQEGLGGSFTYCTLGEPIDTEGLLTGEHLPEYSALASYVLHTCSGISAGANDLQPNDDGLFYRNGETDYYLLYRPDVEWLRSHEAMFTADMAQRIAQRNRDEAREAIVFAPGKYIGQRDLTAMKIRFCQLPYQIHQRL